MTPEGMGLFAVGWEQATGNKQQGRGGGHVTCCLLLVDME
jgi:hypothetical protein